MVAAHRAFNFNYARQRPRIVQRKKPLRLLYIFDQSALTWICQAFFEPKPDTIPLFLLYIHSQRVDKSLFSLYIFHDFTPAHSWS